MNNQSPNRIPAMTWWNAMSYEDKFFFIIKHKSLITGYPFRNPYDLTGREIELIQQLEHPQTIEKGEDVRVGGFTGGKWEYTQLKGIKEFCIHSGGDQICYTDKMDSKQTQEANANRIVNCVNNFDAMYSALKRLLPFVTDNISMDLMELVNDTPQNAMNAAKAIINQIDNK